MRYLTSPSLLDERIDFVLVRRWDDSSKSVKGRGRMKVEIVGEQQRDRTPTNGLWPADHAGLVAALNLQKSGKSSKSDKSGN